MVIFLKEGFILFILRVQVFSLHIDLCTTYLPGAFGGPRETSDLMELESQMIASHHVGAGNQSQVLGKSRQTFNC